MPNVYKNSTELMELHSVPVYMNDIVDACLMSRLNLFLQGGTGSGKTQLARDAMSYFGDKSLFILGRNDMDTRELFQQINLEKLRSGKSSAEVKELTDKINYNLIVVDELPNCVPAVRAQLFNLFDGYIEIDGKAYPIGKDYSVGIATGNLGQEYTESANELGRALKDRMHIIIDTDYFCPSPSDTLDILAGSINPRVEVTDGESKSAEIIEEYQKLKARETPLEKLIIANYLIHGLDYCSKGSKRKMKSAWPNQLDEGEQNHDKGSDIALTLPVSIRAGKSIIAFSQALDEIARRKGASDAVIEQGYFDSMMQAFKLASAYSGILNDAAVDLVYRGDKYAAMDAIIATTKAQFDTQADNIAAGLEMTRGGKVDQKVLDKFKGRWAFTKSTLEGLMQK